MKRIFLAVACGAVLALPVGAAIGTEQDEPVGYVPASECPEAVQARADAGLPPVDTFAPACPDPSDIKPEPQVDVLERNAACEEHYTDDPSWCPTDEEVADAEATEVPHE